MGKHLLDETAEFAMPRLGRHASPETGELQITQRMTSPPEPHRAVQPRPDRDIQAR